MSTVLQTEKAYEGLPLYLNVPQICSVLQIGRTTAYELIRCGRIPSIRVGKQIRVPREALRTLIEND